LKKKHILLAGVGLALFLAAGFVSQVMLEQRRAYTETLSRQARMLAAVAKVDQIRTANIEKVLSVINRYNPSMPLETKYRVAGEISDASMKYQNLDVELICATITHESAFTWDPRIISHAGAMGLMQVMPATGHFLADIEGIQWTSPEQVLFDPVTNIRLGARYLSSLIEMYEVDGGLAAYNGGGRRAALWLAKDRAHGVLFAETQHYVPAVLSLYEQFRTLN